MAAHLHADSLQENVDYCWYLDRFLSLFESLAIVALYMTAI